MIETNFRDSYKRKKTRSLIKCESLENQIVYFDYARMIQMDSFMKNKGLFKNYG